MAEESGASLVKPQKNNIKARKPGIQSAEKTRHVSSNSSASRYRRASAGSYNIGDSSGSSSSGKLNSPNNSQEAIPHYLRASTGSCHDFCKYGRKHTFEEKPWRPLLKRISKPPPSDQLVLRESPIPLERKKVLVVKPVSPHDAKAHLKELNPSSHAKPLASNPPEVIKHEVPLPSKKLDVSPKQESASGKKMPITEQKSNSAFMRHSPLGKPKALVVKSSPSFGTSATKIGSSRRNSNVKDGVGKTAVVSKASLKKILRPADAPSSSRPAITENVNLKSRKNRNVKLMSPLKDHNISQKATSVKTKNGRIPEKTLHVIKIEALKSLAESVQNGDVTTLVPIPSNQSPKTMSRTHFPSSPHKELQVEEGDETQEEEEDGEGEEETELKKNEPNKRITDNSEPAILNEKKIIEGNCNRTLKKGRAVIPKDKDSSSLKLKFRRGKVVELQSESNSPRRLQFRRGRFLVGNQDGKADARRSFKKKAPVDEKVSANPSTGNVVLRHQDVQDKKDSQGLLNNVIEETASKLVESRKSKVKALVGAFETVISLQETKPSSQAVNT